MLRVAWQDLTLDFFAELPDPKRPLNFQALNVLVLRIKRN